MVRKRRYARDRGLDSVTHRHAAFMYCSSVCVGEWLRGSIPCVYVYVCMCEDVVLNNARLFRVSVRVLSSVPSEKAVRSA